MVVALEFVKGLVLISADYIGNIALGVDITDFCIRPMLVDQIANGLDQVSFTQTDAAVNKQWVVGSAGVFADLYGCRTGELIGFAGDQRIKGEIWVEARCFICHRQLPHWVGGRTTFNNGLRCCGGGGWRSTFNLAVSDFQLDLPNIFAEVISGVSFDADEEAIFDELERKLVWCKKQQGINTNLAAEWLDPSIELLG